LRLFNSDARERGEITEKEFPDKGILWRDWNDDTLRIIQEKNRPVLLFVADPDPFVAVPQRNIQGYANQRQAAGPA
jgi:hypothetical protein